MPSGHVATGALIQILEPDVVERIAAGEVIERPVSVVRELLDNALDAGARTIRIDVRGGGLRSIRVVDDGVGIRADQVDLALRHHATSKLRRVDDLVQVSSLGFRGEALPSIAAVSEFTITSATGNGHPGVQVEVRYGEAPRRLLAARGPGTTVTVRNLFGATPARLKFMGTARAESALIAQTVKRYCLAHPDVSFRLILDGHHSTRTSGRGIEHALSEVLGPEVSGSFLPLGPTTTGQCEVTGYVSGRHATRSSRQHIVLLVNERCVTSRALLAAFEDGYRPVLPRGRHPIALLKVHLPRECVDVNVHPSKAEVKIQHELEVAEMLREAVRDALGKSLGVPSSATHFALSPTQHELPRLVAEPSPEWEIATGERLRSAHVISQVHGSLIMVEDQSGLYLVDQHRAHERAIYELLLRRHGEGRAGQMLLEPLHVELSASQVARLEPRLGELAALGFECEWFGGRSFLVRSVPLIPESSSLDDVVADLLDLVVDETDWQHRLMTSLACRTAIRRGAVLTPAQCREIISLLADTESPAVCPHGSPIILHFSDQFLGRQFDW